MKNYLILYFFLAAILSWLIWMPLYAPAFGWEVGFRLPYHHAWGALGPIVAAFITTYLEFGKQGLQDLIARMLKWRVNLIWYIIVFLLPFAIFALRVMSAYFINGTPIDFSGIGVSKEFPGFSMLGFFIYNIISFGFGEETGWRGYALPKLQGKYPAFKATLLLTFGWAIWHTPLFLYRPGYVEMGWAGIPGWVLSLLTGAVLLTWVYNSTKGSILLCAIFHATIDIAFTSDIVNKAVMNYEGVLITCIGIAVALFYGLKNLSKQPKQALNSFVAESFAADNN